MHFADALKQFFTPHVLEEIRFRPSTQSAINVLIAIVRGKHDDAGIRISSPDLIDGIHAVHARYSQIHQRDVGAMLFPKFRRLLSVASVGHHVHIRFLFDDCDQSVAENGMIFSDQNLDKIQLSASARPLFVSGIGNESRITASYLLTHVRLHHWGLVWLGYSE